MRTSRNAKTANHARRGERPEGANGRFWTQRIAPKDAALLSETLRPCHVVVKNCGAHNVVLVADHGDFFDLSPGQVRATYVNGALRVDNHGDEAVIIEVEFLPAMKK